MENTGNARDQAATAFRDAGGTLRMSEALRRGVSRHTLYAMVEDGTLKRLSRGLYRLADLEPVGNPDLVTVSQRIPDGVICLVSALDFHGLTTQIPHVVWVAIPRGNWEPRLDWPPIRLMEFGERAYQAGVETHELDGVAARIYCPEKTVADCFKYRNKIGPDIAVEALRLYWRRRQPDLPELMRYARICRVNRIMRPYLEVLQ